MGLFDTLIGEAVCPVCNSKCTLPFQTKALECLLLEFRIGDKLQTTRFCIEKGALNDCLGTCPICGASLEAEAVIEDGKFVGFRNVRRWKRKPKRRR